MRASKSFVAGCSVLAICSATFFSAVPASAYVACNKYGDCWRTGTKVEWAGVILSFHDDSWWDEHKADAQYHWHDEDAGHHWNHGYWRDGKWYGGF